MSREAAPAFDLRNPFETWSKFSRRHRLTKQQEITVRLIFAVEAGKTSIIGPLLTHKDADVNAPAPACLIDYDRSMPIHHVMSVKALTLLCTMSSRTLNLDAQDKDGHTLLMNLAEGDQDSEDIVDALIKHGANLEIKDHGGRTAEDIAINNDQSAIAKKLAEAKKTRKEEKAVTKPLLAHSIATGKRKRMQESSQQYNPEKYTKS